MNRNQASLVCFALAASFLIHCGNDSDRALRRGSTVTIAHSYPTATAVDPFDHQPEAYLLFLPLMRINESGELEGVLAKSWDFDPETNEVTYHLRTDVRWHDGVPVTAHDVKFSMDLMTHPDVLKEAPDFFGPVEVIDDSTLKMRIGMGGVHEVFWPKHLLEDLDRADFRNWDFWNHPVGNGPYRFVRFQPHGFLELEASPDYYRGTPAIERVIIKFVGDEGVRELLAGNVDTVLYMRPIDALALKDDPRFKVYHQYLRWWSSIVIYWQHKNPLFQDPEVRRALTMAIDRQELVRMNGLFESTPIIDAPYSRRQLAQNQFPEPIPYDPSQAAELLERVGWIEGEGDGVRENGERSFRFTTLVAEINADMAIYIREQLRQIGVDMEILTVEASVVNQRVDQGEFDAAIRGFTLSYVQRFPAWIGYDNAELRDLAIYLADRSYHADPKEERDMYEHLHTIFQRDVPVTFLGPVIAASVVHRRIIGPSSPWQAGPDADFFRFTVSEGP